MNPPKHVAIIMDGNGRWGIKKKNSRNYGHKKGLETVEKIINEAIKNKIKYLTLFVFSTENWKRPSSEIKYLFNLLSNYIESEINNLIKKNIRIKIIWEDILFKIHKIFFINQLSKIFFMSFLVLDLFLRAKENDIKFFNSL